MKEYTVFLEKHPHVEGLSLDAARHVAASLTPIYGAESVAVAESFGVGRAVQWDGEYAFGGRPYTFGGVVVRERSPRWVDVRSNDGIVVSVPREKVTTR